MNLHALTEYIKYRWKAKSRHGIHSPFVYQLIDKCLLVNGAPLRERIDAYFKNNPIILIAGSPGKWQDLLNAHLPMLNNESVLLIENIHGSEAHTKAWNDIARNDTVLLSIDLYTMGLLFFKPEFKIKQHFVLKRNG
jgi:hypothetical protein